MITTAVNSLYTGQPYCRTSLNKDVNEFSNLQFLFLFWPPNSRPQIYYIVIGADVLKSCSGSILYSESKFPVTVVLLELA